MSHEKRMKITSQLADRSLMLDNPVSSSRHNRAQQLQQQHQLPQHQQRGASLAAVKLRGRSRGASVRVSSLRSAVTWAQLQPLHSLWRSYASTTLQHCSGQAPESGPGTPGTARMLQQQQALGSSTGGGTAGMALASSSAVQDSQLALLRCLDLHGAQLFPRLAACSPLSYHLGGAPALLDRISPVCRARWLRPVYSRAKRSQVKGLMSSTSHNIRFHDRDVSAALNIRRCAVGPGPRPTELCYWDGRPAMPKPGRPGQEWVYLPDKALLRKWRRKWQRQ
ncbi:hypothetical protein QJQ45_001564 [Haematococcus lacustris]|nr:hypothetical protein QJQ45_001564 [Haematococcus lacustris]